MTDEVTANTTKSQEKKIQSDEEIFEEINKLPPGEEWEEKKVLKYTRDRVGCDIFRMIMENDYKFFAKVLASISRSPTKDIPTAGVWFNEDKSRFELIYNPDFFSYLTTEQRTAIFAHEAMHIVFDHVTTRKKDNHTIWNIATDLTINSELMEKLPEGVNIPGRGKINLCLPGVGRFENFKKQRASEVYYRQIMNDEDLKKELECAYGGDGAFDYHGGWGKPDEGKVKVAKERLKRSIKRCYQDAMKDSSYGNIPEHIRKRIEALFKNQVDWRRVLGSFVTRSVKATRYNTRKRVNRRYPMIHPGRARRREARIAVSIDQSGSVDDELLTMFFSELRGLSRLATFVVIPFSSEVREDEIFTWKKGSNREVERVDTGGTDFQCVTDYVNKNSREFDGHVILTDMGAPEPGPTRVQRMWLTEEQYMDTPYFDPRPREIMIPIRRIDKE